MTHAYDQAKAQLQHIQDLMAAYRLDWDRYHEAKEELDDIEWEIETLRATSVELVGQVEELQAGIAEIAEFDAARMDCEDSDEVMELIMEYPLSVEVRSGWVSISESSEMEPEEFCILLCTGGPAVRIMGEVESDGLPSRAWIEYCDWGTPWTPLDESSDDVLEFAQMFIYVY